MEVLSPQFLFAQPLWAACLHLTSCVCGSSSCQVFQSKDVPDNSTSPEEFIRKTKGITVATAKAVAAGNSAQQDDVISTANLSRKAISDMLTTCKVLIHSTLCQHRPPAGTAGLPENVWAQPCWEQIMWSQVCFVDAAAGSDSVAFQSHASSHQSERPPAPAERS